MQWHELSPLKLYEVREILEQSPTYVRSNDISDVQSFCENLFMEELPGKVHFELLVANGENVGFIKYIIGFPLPGFTNIRLLVFKEDKCGKGYGSEVINKLKTEGTLWIESPEEQFSLPFWEGKGFKQEAGRWVLQPSRI